MLSLYKLEIFNTVALEGSFSRAAERLLLSQPAVSQHMRDLEESLGTELFVRGPRGVQLTAAGETLLDYTRCILRLLSEAENAVAGLQGLQNGQILIGATPGASVYLLPDWIQTFHQRFPDLSILLRTDVTHSLASEAAAGRIDLAFIEGEIEVESPLNVMILREILLYVIVGNAHPWAALNSVKLQALNGQPFVARPHGSQTRAWVQQVFDRHGIRPDIIAEFDNPESIKQAVASGLGITILPDWGSPGMAGSGRLKALPIEGVDLRRALKLVWSSEATMKPAVRAFLSHLTEQFPQLTQLVASGEGLDLRLPRRDTYKASLNCSFS